MRADNDDDDDLGACRRACELATHPLTRLPQTRADVAEFFGSIGRIKIDKKSRPPKPKIWLYRDKSTGGLKGDGTVSYEDPFSASSAVEWFNKKEWKGGCPGQRQPAACEVACP